MLRLLALVQKSPGLSPGQRFRLEQWAPHLRADHGITIEFSPFESAELTEILYAPGRRLRKARLVLADTLRRRQDLRRSGAYDGVIVYREAAALGPALYERLFARRLPLLYDFDDAIWIPVAGSPNGAFARLRFPGKTAAVCRLSRLITVGNQSLAAWAKAQAPGAQVAVVPTSVDLSRCTREAAEALPHPRSVDEPLVIVWSGSHSTLPYLEALREPLQKLGRERRVVLRIIANAPPLRPFADVVNCFVPWREAEEASAISAAHIGVMPLPDEPFTRGKCGLKALLYMACGVPAVVSPVGVNRDIVRPSETGLWASDADGWLSALRALGCPAQGAALRARLSQAGRRLVEAEYSAPRSAARYAQAVHQALAPLPHATPPFTQPTQ